MIASSFVYRLARAFAACLTLIEAPRLYAQDADLSESLRLALGRYADLAPLAVTWTQTTEATSMGREKIAADMLAKNLRDGSFVQQLAFRDGRIYMRRETKGDSSWPPRTEEIAFDRNLFFAAHNLFYAGNPGNADLRDRPYLHKWLPKNDDPQASYFRDDYFRAVGVRLPTRTKELASSWHPQSELLALLAEGGRVEAVSPANLDERPLVRVQVVLRRIDGKKYPLRRYDFYLDPERGYTIRRHETRDEAGRLLIRFDCTEFEQLSGRLLWMPHLCRVTEYVLERVQDEKNSISDIFTSPLYVKVIRVNALDVQPWPDDRFQLKCLTPGVYVNDASFPETTGKDGVFYQIPANPQRLDEVIALRRAFYQAWRKAEKKSRPLRVLFLVLNGVGLASIAVCYFRRRRKKASCS
jgi:hypothetical protein